MTDLPDDVNDVTGAVLEAAFTVHSEMGPGLLEHVYRHCLAHELRSQGYDAKEEVKVPVVYKGEIMDIGFRADIIVEQKVIVETKAIQSLAPIHRAQLLTYLKLTGVRVGWLFNFHEPRLKDGYERLVR